MKILLKNAKIVDLNSPYNQQIKDVLITNGRIEKIEDNLNESVDRIIDNEGLHVSTGWFDFRANFQDPGHEYKEDIHSGIKSAAKGGFTGVLLSPNTTPPISNKSSVEYIRTKSANQIVDVFPTGTVSYKLEGKELSEMYDMKVAGAKAFTDDKQSISDSGLMSRALLYAKNFDGLICNFPLDKDISSGAFVNESTNTTKLGFKGIPSLAEEIMVTRDIYLAKYHNARVHIGPISTKKSIELIKQAKEEGVNISCDVSIHNLIYTDDALSDFDSNFKLMPPLRNEEDRAALIQGVVDGFIDIVSSDHTPEDVEHKELEFDYANFGSVSLESFFGVLMTLTKNIVPLDILISKFSINPRSILKLDTPVIDINYGANLTLFILNKEYTFNVTNTLSKSKNSAYNGCEMGGEVIGVINNNKIETF